MARVLIIDIISYPLFADADTGIYPHAASQYHARPKAKRGIAMLKNILQYGDGDLNEFVLSHINPQWILTKNRIGRRIHIKRKLVCMFREYSIFTWVFAKW